MGGFQSLFRGRGANEGLSIRKQAMGSVRSNISHCKDELQGHQSHHRWVVSMIVKVCLTLELIGLAVYWIASSSSSSWVMVVCILWPLLCWMVKRIMDTYYQWRIRRGEQRLEAFYAQQKKLLNEIESDPDFKERVELLKQFGKELPGYRTIIEPEVHEPPPRPAPPKTKEGIVHRTPAHPPSTPSVYVQPVVKPPPTLGRKHVPPPSSSNSVFSHFIDILVGEGMQLSIPLDCLQCGANNGLISKEEASGRSSFVCTSCKKENIMPVK